MSANHVNERPDLLLHLRFVVLKVQEHLRASNLNQVSVDTGISYSNLCRLRGGGVPSLSTLELLAYYFSPKPVPKPTDLQKLTSIPLESLVMPSPLSESPWI